MSTPEQIKDELDNEDNKDIKKELSLLQKQLKKLWVVPIDSSLNDWINSFRKTFWRVPLEISMPYEHVPWITTQKRNGPKRFSEWDESLFYNCRLTQELWTVAYENAITYINWKISYQTHKETFYSENVLPWGALDIPWRHSAKDWTIRDADWYICIAANTDYFPKWSIVMTTLWPGKVYDTGGMEWRHIDIYTNRD